MFRYATALRSNNTQERRAAVKSLCQGTVPGHALEFLVPLLDDEDSAVQEDAARAVVRVSRAEPDLRQQVVDAAKKLLATGKPTTRMRGIALAAQLEADATPLIPILTSALRDSNRIICRLAAQALCRTGAAATPALLALLDDRGPYVRDEARWALDQLNHRPPGRRAPPTQITRRIDASASDSTARTLEQTQRVVIIPPAVHERRQATRFACRWNTLCREFCDRVLDVWWEGQIHDISTGGIGLILPRRPIPGARLAIDLVKTNAHVPRRPLARVLHCRQDHETWILGCQFIHPLRSEEVQTLRSPSA